MGNLIKTYTNKDITIKWEPAKCIHSTKCWKGEEGLIDVFNPREKPWIKPDQASTDKIVAQIRKCPSGALSFTYNDPLQKDKTPVETTNCSVHIQKNGPLLVKGTIDLVDAEGNVTKHHQVTALCRCGQSANKPFCDGAHVKAEFTG